MKKTISLIVLMVLISAISAYAAPTMGIDLNPDVVGVQTTYNCQAAWEEFKWGFYITGAIAADNIDQISARVDYDNTKLQAPSANKNIPPLEFMMSGGAGISDVIAVSGNVDTNTDDYSIAIGGNHPEWAPTDEETAMKNTFYCKTAGTITAGTDIQIVDTRDISTTKTWWAEGDLESGGVKTLFEAAPVCIDNDNDGYGSPGDASCTNGAETDCNNANSSIYPGATELCNGVNDDCDGSTDEDFNVGQTCNGDSNSCEDYNTGNYVCTQDEQGTICDASVPDERSVWDNACTSSANSCGDTNAGVTDCNGACDVSIPDERANYGDACSSSANSCGDTNQGTIGCDGLCDASVPDERSVWNNACTSSANSCGDTNAGVTDCDDVCDAVTPDERPNYGDACTSSANSCGATNQGTIQCDGTCDAVTPEEPINYGDACSSDPNSCGDTNAGTIACDGLCDAAIPDERSVWNNACTSAPNSCGGTNDGVTDCDGVCNAVTPTEPENYGDSCTSDPNSCGDTNAGTIACDGLCDAAIPDERSVWNNACTSSANICGDTNAGLTDCEGICDASTPADPANYGDACSSDSNSCGDTNQGTMGCDDLCDASVPDERSVWNNACTSSANSCGDTNAGVTDCDDVCDAVTPDNPTGYGDACTVGIGACESSGTIGCDGLCDATPGEPSPETCNGIDDNCNGQTDESLTRDTTCGQGECAGNAGIETCSAGSWGGDTCDPMDGAVPEVCEGSADEDCDGSAEEGCDCIIGVTQLCSQQDGVCEGSEVTCTSEGKLPECDYPSIEGYESTEANCDNLDNDCDGSTDESITQSCGTEDCEGTQTCLEGNFGDCSTEGNDGGDCALCDADGNQVYDETQDSDCAACPQDECGIADNDGVIDDYYTYPTSECQAINKCTSCEPEVDNADEECLRERIISIDKDISMFSLPLVPETPKTFNEIQTGCTFNLITDGDGIVYWNPTTAAYVRMDENAILYPGQGYFTYQNNDCDFTIQGYKFTMDYVGYLNTDDTKTGWNMIGAPSDKVNDFDTVEKGPALLQAALGALMQLAINM